MSGFRAVLAAAALVLAAPAVMAATSAQEHPAARGCRHVVGAVPGWFLDAGTAGETTTVGAAPCRFTATTAGGVVSSAGSYVLTVERDGEVAVHRGHDGGCADGLIEAGDRVTLEAAVLAAAGAGSGC